MNAQTTRPAPGRPKDPAKRAAVLEAARQLFASNGFDGVSMDQIAQAAGVSKLTVYSHFGDKERLLSAAVESYCEQEMPKRLFEPQPQVPLRDRLLGIARAFHELVNCPRTVSANRMLCSPNALTPDLARRFWEAGPARIQAGLAALLRRRVAAGELVIDDCERAASHLLALLKGEPHARLMIGHPDTPDAAAIERHLQSAVDLFLRAHRASPP